MQASIVFWFAALGGALLRDDAWNNGWMFPGAIAMGVLVAWAMTWVVHVSVKLLDRVVRMRLLKSLHKSIFKIWVRRYRSLKVRQVRIDPLTGGQW